MEFNHTQTYNMSSIERSPSELNKTLETDHHLWYTALSKILMWYYIRMFL